jgi:Xaa-Pro dipeptidase
MDKVTARLGARLECSLALLNEARAFPHGSVTPQTVREGGLILMGCSWAVQGSKFDISRTWVHGEASPSPRKV